MYISNLLCILERQTGQCCPSSSIVLLQSVQKLACLQGMNFQVLVLGDRQTTQQLSELECVISSSSEYSVSLKAKFSGALMLPIVKLIDSRNCKYTPSRNFTFEITLSSSFFTSFFFLARVISLPYLERPLSLSKSSIISFSVVIKVHILGWSSRFPLA